MDKVKVEITCVSCGKNNVLYVPAEGLKKREQGELIQNCFPTLSADERELFVSKICGTCFDAMFKEDEE